jgi:hypothetical protein
VHLSADEAWALSGWLAALDIVHLEDTGAVAPRPTYAAVIAVLGALYLAGFRGGR